MRISVITVCKNAKGSLARTMESVWSQTYPNIEHIVIDGASTDGTVAFLQEHERKLSFSHDARLATRKFQWISEPDSGIYEAMNKGIRKSSGDMVTFLNAGDVYLSDQILDAVMRDVDTMQQHLFSADIFAVSVDGQQTYEANKAPDKIDAAYLRDAAIPHPGVFYRRSFFDIVGLYDEQYRIAGDHELHVRAVQKYRLYIGRIKRCVVLFQLGGISSSPELDRLHDLERKRIKECYYDDQRKASDGAIEKILSFFHRHLMGRRRRDR